MVRKKDSDGNNRQLLSIKLHQMNHCIESRVGKHELGHRAAGMFRFLI